MSCNKQSSNYCSPNQRIQEELDDLYNKINDMLPSILPKVTVADNGKFLRVVEGIWAASIVPYAEDNKF